MKPGNWNSFSRAAASCSSRGINWDCRSEGLALALKPCSRFSANSGGILCTIPKLEPESVQPFPCSSRSEMMRQLPRRPANDASIARPRGSLKEARDVLAVLLLMTGPVSSKYLMMGDIWSWGAGCHSDGNSEQHVSNPVCHCQTAIGSLGKLLLS